MSRRYSGQTAEDRTADRRARLIDFGVEVVGTQGVSALGVRSVCRAAGLSQKFFYESFADTDVLLHAVYRAALARLEEAVAPAVASGDLYAVFEAAARLMEADPRICRILLVEPVADARLRGYVRETIPAIATAALGDRIVGSPDDPGVRMRFSALFGAIISLFVEWTEGSLGTDRDAFATHLTAVVTQLMSGVSSDGTGRPQQLAHRR
ncbi:MAG: Transcriptional regulator, TetR family [Nocardia sp.]|uniref:TetR/AcrR family transcriptional regulator n=1 Tax=Nocardia sp. TaxID=1821 RepID=UPI0026299AD2|nr:TetR/AcrR family transcriptional regulator [Nocardia sp.]MCU1647481.1 Transcriptional regulator, TetR family [Nocardia sp.]